MSILFRRTLLALLLTLGATLNVRAQRVPGDPDMKLPPALTGNNARVLVGTQRGTILIATSTPDTLMITDSVTAGAQLPSEVTAVWMLSMPNRVTLPQLVIGIVSYRNGSETVYGAIRSTDMGATWTLVKDAALADARFKPANAYWATTNLREMTWLDDGNYGWVFGPPGIIATTDGGLTWEVRHVRDDATRTNTNALAFRDPLNGVASIGWYPEQRFRITTDGGVTWALRGSPLGTKRVNQIDWIGNEFRAFVFDRAQLAGGQTTYLYRAFDFGQDWEGKLKSNVLAEQTYVSELVWLNARTGFMTMRSGEVAVTQDRGNTWSRILEADSVNYRMPLSLNSGFGYNSIILDNRFIVQAATLRTDGVLDTLVQWDLGAASVGDERRKLVRAVITPTPSRDQARLVLDRPVAAGTRYSVFDAAGTLRIDGALEAGAMSVALDVSALSPGMYRVVVDDAARRASAPLVVTR